MFRLKTPRISLLRKALFAFAITLFPIAVAFIYTYNENSRLVKKNALEDHIALADALETRVYLFIEMQKMRAQDFSSDGFIRERLQTMVKGNKSTAPGLNAHLIKNKLSLDKTIKHIHILSLNGRVAASTYRPAIGKDMSNEIFFAKGIREPSVAESDIALTGEHLLAVSSLITDKDSGEPIGVLVNLISIASLNDILNGGHVKKIGAMTAGIRGHFKTLEAYLVNKDKLMITESLFIKDAALKQRVDTPPVRKCAEEHKEFSGFYKNYLGAKVGGVSMCLPALKWTLLVEVDLGEIMTPAGIMRRNALITIFTVAAIVFILFVLFFRNVILPLRRASRSAEAIANGEYDIALPVETKDEIGMLSASFNVMSHNIKNRTESLKESEKRLMAMIEIQQKYEELVKNLPVGVYRRMLDGRIVEANPAVVAMFDAASKEELIRHNALSLYRNKNRAKEVSEKMLKHGLVKDEDVEVLTIKGRPIACSFTATTKTDKQGNAYIDGIIQDVTEKRMLEAQLRHSQKMEAIGRLAGGIAHDFNNILTAIIGYGSLLLKKKQDDDMLKDYIGEILGAAKRAATLTKDLLSFSRKHIIAAQPFDLNEIVKNTEKILARLIGEHIDLKVNLAKRNLVVKIDPVQIEQALLNLATNARDAMPNGGRLLIGTDVATIDNSFIIAHSYGKSGSYAVLTFEDTGTGMTKEVQSRLFEPFFTTKEVGKGTGLGLSSVYGIVKQHGGYINVYSEPGHGSAFKIYLPMAGEVMALEEKTLPDSIALRGNMETILIAEDDPGTRKIIRTVLEEYNYKVIETESGNDAINKFTANKDEIRLIILDIIMPKKGGLEAYKEIKKIKPDAKAIFLSGYTGDMIKAEDINREGLDIVSKPVAPNELSIKIKEALGK